MNRKKNGFTFVELLAVIVLLGIIVGIALITVNGNFGNAKKGSQRVFIGTIEDALDAYLNSSSIKRGEFTTQGGCIINKTHKNNVVVSKLSGGVSFNDVITSEYAPISVDDLVNPADKDAVCVADLDAKIIDIYRDEDYVYYYKLAKSNLTCLVDDSADSDAYITNLPRGSSCIG